MSDYLPAKYIIPSAVKGDSFPPLVVSGVTVGGEAMTSALTSVRMDFRTTPNASTASKALTSAGGDITIDDATAWGFTVETFSITMAARKYVYDIELTDAGGTVRTYLAGTFTVASEVTRT